ncbi:MAG TPA: alanine--tRNA ligase [Gemmatimonadales bacterium]|nr:alanine--tRNA ligase [Gemmatimonadales bacterium]
MHASEIRRRFIEYFEHKGHQPVASSSLLPADDPTLLFTNAGMNQFKRTFLGVEPRDYLRAVTCQKCVRAGGKHNDLEQVGHTKRHHTFFEMLGNFSFGDYFKRDAIAFAWEFVTSPEWLGIPPERLWVTVHETDTEARDLWRKVPGLREGQLFGLGDKDNFWQMGDTGPCGPCSEIYVDIGGGAAGQRGSGAALTRAEFEEQAEAGRFLEIWNLVFMQFDRSADGTLTPLPKPSVDTGAGLERIAAVLQGEDSNFHTDLFLPLLDAVAELVGRPYDRGPAGGSYRVLADHARAVSFLLADGVVPSNEGRGYVLRRILRRAVRHAWLLGRREPTLAPLTAIVIREMGAAYPELQAKAEQIRQWTVTEEERFLETIEGGLKRMDELLASGLTVIPGDEAFKLYDTYGFPIDLTMILAEERGASVDLAGFEAALAAQRQRSRDHRLQADPRRYELKGAPAVMTKSVGWRKLKRSKQKFVGYQHDAADTEILAFRQDPDAQRVELLLKENPFYAESGGQVSDTGFVRGEGWVMPVDQVRKGEQGTVVGGAFRELFEPTSVFGSVDVARRRNIERNHSATHLVHAALRKYLGTHVHQQGSLVDEGRLRFDFSHHGPIEPDVLQQIEREVNARIWENLPVDTREMAYPDALALGAMALFSEKYGDVVRVVSMGESSIELCGGTHVRSTGQIGLFQFAAQGGVAAGVRRIEAVTGPEAYTLVESLQTRIAGAAAALKAQPDHLLRKLDQLLEERERLHARVNELLRGGAAAPAEGTTLDIGGVAVTLGDTAVEDREEVLALVDGFRTGKSGAVLVLFGTAGRGAVHVAVTDDLVKAGRKAGDLAGRIAAVSGGKGGGRPQFASAGAGDLALLPAARAEAPGIIASWLRGEG